jgi:hypothetical protein
LNGRVRWLHVVAAWSCFPTSWDSKKFGCLLAGDVQGDNTVQLLGGVPEKVI